MWSFSAIKCSSASIDCSFVSCDGFLQGNRRWSTIPATAPHGPAWNPLQEMIHQELGNTGGWRSICWFHQWRKRQKRHGDDRSFWCLLVSYSSNSPAIGCSIVHCCWLQIGRVGIPDDGRKHASVTIFVGGKHPIHYIASTIPSRECSNRFRSNRAQVYVMLRQESAFTITKRALSYDHSCWKQERVLSKHYEVLLVLMDF